MIEDDLSIVSDAFIQHGIDLEYMYRFLDEKSKLQESKNMRNSNYVNVSYTPPETKPQETKKTTMDPSVKKKILSTYDYIDVSETSKKLYLPHIENTNTSKTRYRDGQVVTKKGEKFIERNLD
jgi:hypothetical protein